MIYSCFDPKSGLYDYYEGPDTYPINADLPVPNFLPAEIPGIGVPSIDAARPMPNGLTMVGKGWHARGMVVNCGRSALGDFMLTGLAGDVVFRLAAYAAVAAGIYYLVRPRQRRRR